MPYVSRGCSKRTQKRKVEIRGITSLIEGDIFLASISTHFFLCFFYFFCIFVFFVCLGGFPLNMVVCGRRLLGPFLDVFQKPIKI